jgi:hypothetical protein
LHGIAEKFIDNMAETVAALKRSTHARVVMLGSMPVWRRGLPNEVLKYYLLHHRLIPVRASGDIMPNVYDAELRRKLVPKGAKFISGWDVFCNADGCLARLVDEANDISASDVIHLTEKGSIFLIQAIIDQVLKGEAAPATNISQ